MLIEHSIVSFCCIHLHGYGFRFWSVWECIALRQCDLISTTVEGRGVFDSLPPTLSARDGSFSPLSLSL